MAQRITPRDFNMSFYFGGNTRITSATAIFDPSTTDFSVNLWFKLRIPNSGTIQALAAQLDGTGTGQIWLAVSATGVIETFLSDGLAHVGTTVLKPAEWNMVTLTKTGTTITIYVNSVLDTTFTLTTQAASGAFQLGESKTNASAVSGYIADPQLYQTLLVQANITALYYQGLRPSTPYLWYKLDEGQGTTATDSGSAGKNGTITAGSGAFSTDVPIKARFPLRDFGTSIFNAASTSWCYSASTDFNVTGSFSMGCWFKRGRTNLSTFTLMGKGRAAAGGNNYSYTLFLDGGSHLQMRISKTGTIQESQIGATNVPNLQDQNWHHGACTYQQVADGTSIMTIYQDGQVIAKLSTAVSPLAASTADFGVGADFTGAGHAATGVPWNGWIDEPFFYNGVLTQAQIKDLMTYGTTSTLVPMTDANLFGFWKFDDGSGTSAVDSSSRGNNLTVNVSSSWSREVVMRPRPVVRGFGSAGFFNGTDNYVNIPANAGFTPAQLSHCAWVKTGLITNGNGAEVVDVGGNSGWRYRIGANGGISIFDRGGTHTLSSVNGVVPRDTWAFLAVTLASTGLSIYVNGVLVIADAVAYGAPSLNTAMHIGNLNGGVGGAEYMVGRMDEHQFYNVVLTASQINQLYLGQILPTSITGLVGYWKFDENTGTSIADSSGNGNTATWNGTLGSQWSTDVPMLARSTATGRSSI